MHRLCATILLSLILLSLWVSLITLQIHYANSVKKWILLGRRRWRFLFLVLLHSENPLYFGKLLVVSFLFNFTKCTGSTDHGTIDKLAILRLSNLVDRASIVWETCFEWLQVQVIINLHLDLLLILGGCLSAFHVNLIIAIIVNCDFIPRGRCLGHFVHRRFDS